MQICSINYNGQKTEFLPHTKKSSKQMVFEGYLTRLAQKRPTISADLLDAANKVYTRDNGIVGVFPPEFVKAIKVNLGDECTSQRIKECIEGTKATFAEATKLFKNLEEEGIKIQEKWINELSLSKYYNFTKKELEKIYSTNSSKAINIDMQLKKKLLPKKITIKQIEIQASKIIENGLKENKCITENSKIIIKRLDDGKFGTAYKISFYDKNNNKIFKDKVIKYYKNLKIVNAIKVKQGVKIFDIINNNYTNAIIAVEKILKNFLKKKYIDTEKFKKVNTQEIRQFINRTKECQEEILKKAYNDDLIQVMKKHGINKETNIGNFIKKASGHNLQKTDLISFYYGDLNKNYALLEYSSNNNLGLVVKKVDYDTLGVIPNDINKVNSLLNFVNGRLIDYGGFEITSKILAENPVARRIYKKVKHIEGKDSVQKRINRINELYEKALKNKLPQSSDVISGLKESVRLIPEDKQGELILYNNIYTK